MIKTILIIIGALYVINLLGKWLIPLFIRHQIKKFQQEEFHTQQRKNYQKKEGSVTINTNTKNNNIDESDFQDYEEIT